MKTKKNVEFVMYGLHPSLFCSEVDQYFICPICYFVASDPVSCLTCEQVFCTKCIDRYSKIKAESCMSCKSPIKTSSLRKFPQKVYDSFFLYCPNYNYQCRFEGGIQEIHAHRAECEFMKINCLNPLCAQNFLSKDRPIPGSDTCSIKCLEVYEVSRLLKKPEKIEISKFFWKCLQEHRKKSIENIEKEYEELMSEGDLAKKQWEKEIGELESRFEEIKSHTHPGKFINEEWNCCQQTKTSIGCAMLVQS